MTAPAVPDVVELEVQSIAAGGDGVGRSSGLVVFVPRTAPGDLSRVRLASVKRFARGHLEEVLRPSPERVEPPCPHYTEDDCGGCQLQHLHYDAQLSAKQSIVGDSLSRIGKRRVDVPSTRASSREWRYRNKLTLAMRRSEGGWMMGLHPYDDPVGIFQLVDCPITDERVVGTWREIMAAAALLPNEAELRGTVRLTSFGSVVLIRGGTSWPTASAFFEAVPSATSLSWTPDDATTRVVHARREAPAGTSFGQVNPSVAAELQAYVVDRIMSYSPATVIDAYAGTGDTAESLATLGARVTAIELDRAAADLCATRLPTGSRSLVGRVENLLMKALPADALIVNPPRAGMDARVTSVLERAHPKPRVVVYVSCDPATLARDVARLPHYRIVSVQPFDMFPQTAHVETVCELVPEGA